MSFLYAIIIPSEAPVHKVSFVTFSVTFVTVSLVIGLPK